MSRVLAAIFDGDGCPSMFAVDARTNSVIVSGADADTLKTIEEVIELLDRNP